MKSTKREELVVNEVKWNHVHLECSSRETVIQEGLFFVVGGKICLRLIKVKLKDGVSYAIDAKLTLNGREKSWPWEPIIGLNILSDKYEIQAILAIKSIVDANYVIMKLNPVLPSDVILSLG